MLSRCDRLTKDRHRDTETQRNQTTASQGHREPERTHRHQRAAAEGGVQRVQLSVLGVSVVFLIGQVRDSSPGRLEPPSTLGQSVS